eukprot:g7393.t1
MGHDAAAGCPVILGNGCPLVPMLCRGKLSAAWFLANFWAIRHIFTRCKCCQKWAFHPLKPKYFAIWDYPKPAKDVMKSLEQLKLSREALDIALGVKKPPGKNKKRPLATGPEKQVSNSGRGGGGVVGGSVARNQKKVVDSSVEEGPSTSGVVGKGSQKKKKQNSYTKVDAALDLGFLMT